jgi:lysophospholipase L1-like esterase
MSPRRALVAVLGALLAVLVVPAPAGATGLGWTATWAASAQQPSAATFTPNWSLDGFANHTVRQVVRVSAGGSLARVRLSNVYGSSPLRLSGATIALAGDGASVVGPVRPLTFRLSRSAVIPTGRELVSDPVLLRVSPLGSLTVSLYFAAPTGPATFHAFASATSYRAAGDQLSARDGTAFTETTDSFYYLAGVEVAGTPARATVVAFGDSITDGVLSTPNANNRYPDELAERLRSTHRPLAVANAGIGGNRVLRDSPCFGESALQRFERDALSVPGARTVVVIEAINDIIDIAGISFGDCNRPNPDLTAAQLIAGHRELIHAAHSRGIRIVGGTVLPYKNNPFGLFTDQGEAVRDGLNEWIRTSGEFDAVVDFEKVVADPADPDQIADQFDGGDKIHPNDAGYHAMAAAINLNTL